MDQNDEETRDTRYQEILKQQLGENGITLITNISLLFILSLFIIISACIASVFHYTKLNNKTNENTITKPAIQLSEKNK